MGRNRDNSETHWGIWVVAILAVTAAQTAFSVGWLKWLKRRATIDERLTERLRQVTKRRYLRVYILDRQSMLEAFACPTGEIFITKDLYDLLTFEEALAVAIHEAGHVVYQTHFWTNLCKTSTSLSLLKKGANPLLSVLAGHASALGSSACHERLADSYAVKKGYGRALSSALATLDRESVRPAPTLQTLPALARETIDEVLHVHPEMKSRIEALANS